MSGDREKAIAAGMNDHIAKPLDVKRMFQTIATWVHPTAAAASVPSHADADHGGVGHWALPGVDVHAGLAGLAGKTSLYRKQLVRFRDSQCDFAATFAEARADADPSAAQRAAHTLKGLAGTIGAHAVREAAAALEAACASGADAAALDAALARTIAELSPVLQGLAQLPGLDPAATALPATIDTATVAPLFDQLEALLVQNDGRAVDVSEDLARRLAGTAFASGFDHVMKQLAAYDFDGAVTQLHHLRSQL